MTRKPSIIVVEDEAIQRNLLVEYLGRHGYAVTGVDSGPALRQSLAVHRPDLVLLDLGLPGEDGLSLARHLRAASARIGIIIVTSSGETVDRVAGLEIGADDYIPKPFEPRELLARVKSVLRRSGPMDLPAGRQVRIGRRVLDLERRLLLDDAGGEEPLTASEYGLLQVLVQNPNRPLSREWLMEAVGSRDADTFDRAIDLRVTRLRRKIEANPANPEAIRTVRGVGYMFAPAKE